MSQQNYEVQMVPIKSIKPYKRNPRKNQKTIAEVAKSISTFGWQQHISVDEDMVIIIGDTRWRAGRLLGHEKVPVKIIKGMPEAKKKALRIMDNRTSEHSKWDHAMLDGELEDILKEDPNLDKDFFGWGEGQQGSSEQDSGDWEFDEVDDEFVLTVKGPITKQPEVLKALEKIKDVEVDVATFQSPRGKKR